MKKLLFYAFTFVLLLVILPTFTEATVTQFSSQNNSCTAGPCQSLTHNVEVSSGFQATRGVGYASYNTSPNFSGGYQWLDDGASVVTCIIGPGQESKCVSGSGTEILLNELNTPYRNYNGVRTYAEYYCTVLLFGYNDPIDCRSGYGAGIYSISVTAWGRTVSIDSMQAPTSANIGQSFLVSWTTDSAGVNNAEVDISSSANITCGAVNSSGNTHSTLCIGTSVANGTVTAFARGPIQIGATGNMKTVTAARNINIVTSGGSGDPPPPPPPNNHTLTVAKAGGGGGTVTSSPAGINCGSTCAANYVNGTSVTLTATPGSGSTFTGWSGACTGTGNCTVSMTAARSVTATFGTAACGDCAQFISQFVNGINASNHLVPATISVTPGQVMPVSITFKNTGTNTWTCCTAFESWHPQFGQPPQGYKLGDWAVAVGQPGMAPDRVNLSSSVAPGQNFTFTFNVTAPSTPGTYTFTRRPMREYVGWFGDSTPYANIVVSAARTLTVTKAGTGTGTVVSTSPASPSINCGSTCTANYVNGTSVTLTASAASGSYFTGWSGACTGTGNCTVSMTAARSVTATFNITAPAIVSTTINPKPAVANASTQHTVTVVASHPLGGANIDYQYAMINIQGANAGQYRGYMVWGVGNWGAGEKGSRSCTGGGYGALLISGAYATYGSQYLELDGCTASVTGNNRTVTFTVRLNTTYTTPVANNTVSGYARDNNAVVANWAPGDTFSLGALTNNAICVSHNIPTTMTAGQVFAATMTFQNTGTKTWTFNGSTNYYIPLNPYPGVATSLAPKDITTQTGTTAPGQNRVVNFNLTAPATPGSYTGTYRMYEAGGSGFFGTPCGPVTVTVSAPAFNYSLSSSGATNAAKSSGTVLVQNTITKTLSAGTWQNVNLSVSGLPSGVTLQSISNNNAGCAAPSTPSCASVVTLAVSPTAPTGAHTITVTGTPLNRTVNFTLNITGNPMSVTCTANPASVLIGQGVTWTANVTGGTAPFTYTWSGTNIPTSPAPNTNPFNITYGTLGQKTATVTVRDADYPSTAQATCPTGVVQVNFNPVFEEF